MGDEKHSKQITLTSTQKDAYINALDIVRKVLGDYRLCKEEDSRIDGAFPSNIWLVLRNFKEYSAMEMEIAKDIWMALTRVLPGHSVFSLCEAWKELLPSFTVFRDDCIKVQEDLLSSYGVSNTSLRQYAQDPGRGRFMEKLSSRYTVQAQTLQNPCPLLPKDYERFLMIMRSLEKIFWAASDSMKSFLDSFDEAKSFSKEDSNLTNYCDSQNEYIVRFILVDMKEKFKTYFDRREKRPNSIFSSVDYNLPKLVYADVPKLYNFIFWHWESNVAEYQAAFNASGFSDLFIKIMDEIYPNQTQYTEEQIPGLQNIPDGITHERKESDALRNIIVLSLVLGTIGFIIDASRFEFAGSEKIFACNTHIGGINIPSGVYIGLGLAIIGVGLWIMKKKNYSTSVPQAELASTATNLATFL
jgi:hypothetical protein